MKRQTNNILAILLGLIFMASSLTKAVNVYSFSQTIHSFCGLLGLTELYGHGVLLAILICAAECLLALLSFHPKYRGLALLACPVVLIYFTCITFINYTNLYGGIESCGCFGEIIHLSPAATFYKNAVMLALALYLLIVYMKEQCREGKPLCSFGIPGGYLLLACLVSAVPPLFSYLFLNRMPHIPYLLLFLTISVTGMLLCIKSILCKKSAV